MAVDVEAAAVEGMRAHCRKAGRLETGGVLLGHYSPWLDRAIVTSVSGPPRDSVHRGYTFVRGVSGLTALFNRAWRRGEHYLGDWHYHPGASAQPSPQDLAQMEAFAADRDYECRRTVLLVVGGNADGSWSLGAHVVGMGLVIALTEPGPPTSRRVP